MFKSLKKKSGFGDEPPTPKISSVSLPGIQSPARPASTQPWLASPRPIKAQPSITRSMTPGPLASPRPIRAQHSISRSTTPAPLASPRPIKAQPSISRAMTPGPEKWRAATPQSVPTSKAAMTPRKRTNTISGDDLEARRIAAKLREDYVPPSKASPTIRQRKLSMTGGESSMDKPKKVTPSPTCTFAPMKPPHLPPVNLHWTLLPYDMSLNKKLLYFDISVPITHMRFSADPFPRRLRQSDLDKPAADEPLEEMIIECEKLPRWLIKIRRPSGICCRDVFEEIFKTYNTPLTEAECRAIPASLASQVKVAFKNRCADSPNLVEWEDAQGFRRVDLLTGKTFFLGLTRPKPSSNWVLQLGTRP